MVKCVVKNSKNERSKKVVLVTYIDTLRKEKEPEKVKKGKRAEKRQLKEESVKELKKDN